MHRLIQAILLSAVLVLTACGGGSSGGAGSGTYAGTYSVLLTSGSNIVRGSGTYVATVSGNSVTIRFDDGTVFSGELSQNQNIKLGGLTGSVVGVVDGCTSGMVTVSVFLNTDTSRFSGVITGDNIVCGGAVVSLTGTHSATRN